MTEQKRIRYADLSVGAECMYLGHRLKKIDNHRALENARAPWILSSSEFVTPVDPPEDADDEDAISFGFGSILWP